MQEKNIEEYFDSPTSFADDFEGSLKIKHMEMTLSSYLTEMFLMTV